MGWRLGLKGYACKRISGWFRASWHVPKPKLFRTISGPFRMAPQGARPPIEMVISRAAGEEGNKGCLVRFTDLQYTHRAPTLLFCVYLHRSRMPVMAPIYHPFGLLVFPYQN